MISILYLLIGVAFSMSSLKSIGLRDEQRSKKADVIFLVALTLGWLPYLIYVIFSFFIYKRKQ